MVLPASEQCESVKKVASKVGYTVVCDQDTYGKIGFRSYSVISSLRNSHISYIFNSWQVSSARA